MMSSERGSDAGEHEMSNLGFESQKNVNTWSSQKCSGEFEGPCIKALIGLLALISLTFVVAGGFFVGRFVNDGSINSAVWAFFTGTVACGIMSLFVLHLTKHLNTWHDKKSLNGIKIFSMVMSAISIIAIIVYVILGFVAKKKNQPTGEDFFISALFSGLCLGCSFLLYFASQWYQNKLPAEFDQQTVFSRKEFDEPQPGPSRII